MDRARPELSIVIVNWNGGAHLLECLRGIATAAQGLSVETIVVDNASSDGSMKAIKDAALVDVVIENEQNRGFPAANNQGTRRARGRYVLFLNPDAYPLGSALRTLLGTMERHPEIGLLGPRIVDAEGRTSRDMGDRFPTPWSLACSFLLLSRLAPRWLHGITRETDVTDLEPSDWICGAAILARREVVERVPWNEELFLHAEDIDYCARVRDAGWEIATEGRAVVVHVGGRSIAQLPSDDLLAKWPSGIHVYLWRRHGRLAAACGLGVMHLGMGVRELAHRMLYHLSGNSGHRDKANKLRLFRVQARAVPRPH